MKNLQDLQIDWLKCFLTVVDTGSISYAAPKLYQSQSALSMQLKKLETALNCKLIVRGYKNIQLTPEGQILLGYARRLLDIHTEAQHIFNGNKLTGKIHLGVPDDYAIEYLTPVLKQFSPYHDGVEIELYCEQSTALIPKIESGELDLALISRAHPKQGTLLFFEPLVWVGDQNFEIWKQNSLPLAVYENTSLARQNAIYSLGLQGRTYRIIYNSSSLAGQIAAVKSGLAIAVFTKCSVPKDLKILNSTQGFGPLEPMQVSIYRSQNSLSSKAVDQLYNLFIRTFRQVQPIQ